MSMSRIALRRLQFQPHRLYSQTAFLSAPQYENAPSPPKLPADEQKRFEALQRASTGAFSTPQSTITDRQLDSKDDTPKASLEESPGSEEPQALPVIDARVKASGKGEELHPDIRRGAKPEFDSERNPKTGEIGGPKNDPLQWKNEWTYNGRATDF